MTDKIAFEFTNPKTGERYRVGPYYSWEALGGRTMTSARVHVVDLESGHGWGGIMKQAEIEAAMRGEA
jgi:hypothetical protein